MVMGAAIEQVPGIKKAKEMGYEVAVIDYNPNAVGIPLADQFYNVSTIDSEGVLEAAKDFNTDGFLTLATDLPMRAVAYASEKLGIPGVSQLTALLATDKGKMIKAYVSFPDASDWKNKIFEGRIEQAGRDHLIISNPNTGEWDLILMIYLDYVTFDEPITYAFN